MSTVQLALHSITVKVSYLSTGLCAVCGPPKEPEDPDPDPEPPPTPTRDHTDNKRRDASIKKNHASSVNYSPMSLFSDFTALSMQNIFFKYIAGTYLFSFNAHKRLYFISVSSRVSIA